MSNPNKDTFKAGVYGQRGQTRQKSDSGGVTLPIAESDVTNLVTDLAGKAATSHVHAGADTTSGAIADARISGSYTNFTSITANGTVTNNGGSYDARRTASGQTAFDTRVAPGDANSRLNVTAAGVVNFGDGTAAADTNLFRSAANTLRTDDSFVAGTNLSVAGTAHVIGTSALDDTVTLGGTLIVNSKDQGKGLVGWVSATTSSGTVASITDIAVMSTPSITFENGRAYSIEVVMLVQSNTASTTANGFRVRIRKTNAAGTMYADWRMVEYTGAANQWDPFYGKRVVVRTAGSNLSTVICATLSRSSVGAATLNLFADTTDVAYVRVEDIGLASDYSGAFALT